MLNQGHDKIKFKNSGNMNILRVFKDSIMKSKICKRIIIIVTLFFLANPLFGQYYFSGLSFGTDLDISENGVNMDIDLTLLQFEIKNNIGLGFGMAFVKYHYISNDHYFCIVNPYVFWNILRVFPGYHAPYFDPVKHEVNKLKYNTFGPFVSINPTFDFNNYLFFTGLRYTEHGMTPSIFYQLECGYKYISDKNIGSFYLSIKFDVFLGLLFIPVLFGVSA
jgi:hypothetical protein